MKMEEKPRYSRISDILEIITLMQSRVMGVTLADIQEELNVSRRTAERLRDSIIYILPQVDELETTGKEKHWGFTSGYMNGIIRFAPDEIATLENLKESLNFDDQKKTISDIITKLKALSRKNIAKIDDTIELILKTEGVAVTQRPSYKIDLSVFETIRQAIKENKKISLIHNNREKILAPYGIIYGENVYLVAVEGDWKNPYVYKMHKLSDIQLTEIPFDKGDFDIKEYANRSFGIYQNELMKVELLFSKEVADDALHYSFHPTQKVKQNEDGSVTVKFKASGELSIIWHLFKWGNNVKIISPKKLKKEYIDILEKTLQEMKN